MMLILPKVRRDGTLKATTIDASEIKGIEEKVFRFQGAMFNGAKVYANGGSFYVAAPMAMVAQAKVMAIKTGDVMEIEAPKVQYVSNGIKTHGMLGAPKNPAYHMLKK